MLIVDASVVVTAVTDSGADGTRFRQRLRGSSLGAPDLVRIETLSALRRLVRLGHVTSNQAEQAVADLIELPIRTFPVHGLLARCWQLRDNIASYDACYVALAEALDCLLLTADNRLANAAGTICDVEVLRTGDR